jgi:D-glycero-D-manno-heptose 1,7-bisphosphate phosphatase
LENTSFHKKAVFFDRDGVLNEKREDYVKSVDELTIISGIEKGLFLLQQNGFELFIITNQSVINRGIISLDIEEKINQKLLDYLKKYGIKITKIYLCPHRPDENCSCRKPKPGLILKAALENSIDLKQSWFIGDSDSDKKAALSAKCKFLLNKTDGDLNPLVNLILSNS